LREIWPHQETHVVFLLLELDNFRPNVLWRDLLHKTSLSSEYVARDGLFEEVYQRQTHLFALI
jgi:hypothetical protein